MPPTKKPGKAPALATLLESLDRLTHEYEFDDVCLEMIREAKEAAEKLCDETHSFKLDAKRLKSMIPPVRARAENYTLRITALRNTIDRLYDEIEAGEPPRAVTLNLNVKHPAATPPVTNTKRKTAGSSLKS